MSRRWLRLARAPAPDVSPAAQLLRDQNYAFMRQGGMAMFFLGAATLLATLPLPDPDTSDHPALKVIAGLLALGGVVVWCARTYRPWLTRATVIYGLLLVSALMGVTRPIEATPFFYLWPILFSAYFFSRREVAINVVLMWVTMAIALFGFSNDPMKGVMFMGAGVSVTLAGVIVMVLREHLTTVIAALEHASATDYLTGLLNRRAFDAELRRQIDRASRTGLPLALVMLDIDHFKQINDRFGHAAGDRALCDVAELLRHEQRSGDTLARVGGEEFAFVLFGAGAEEARTFAERVGNEVQSLRVEGAALSLSAGVAALTGADPEALLLGADRALYAAKSAGRRRVALWDDGHTLIGEPILAAA